MHRCEQQQQTTDSQLFTLTLALKDMWHAQKYCVENIPDGTTKMLCLN